MDSEEGGIAAALALVIQAAVAVAEAAADGAGAPPEAAPEVDNREEEADFEEEGEDGEDGEEEDEDNEDGEDVEEEETQTTGRREGRGGGANEIVAAIDRFHSTYLRVERSKMKRASRDRKDAERRHLRMLEHQLACARVCATGLKAIVQELRSGSAANDA